MTTEVHSTERLLQCLEAQKERIRRRDYHQYEIASAEIEYIVQTLNQTGQLETMPDDQRKKLVDSFRALTLMVASHKQLAAQQLQQVRQGRRTINAYQELTGQGNLAASSRM